MKIEIINQKALEILASGADGVGEEHILACDSGCGCDTGSDWVNEFCPTPEWIVSWRKATC